MDLRLSGMGHPQLSTLSLRHRMVGSRFSILLNSKMAEPEGEGNRLTVDRKKSNGLSEQGQQST
jgi:hypothetical protein